MQQMPSNDVLLQQANPATLSSALPEAIQHTTWKQSVPIGQVQVGEVTAQPETSPPGVQTSPPAGAQTPLTNSCPAGQVTVPPARWHRLGLKHQLLPLAKTQQLQPVVPAQTPGSLAHRRFGQVWAAAGARRSPSTPSVPATKPVSTRRRLVPVASARVMSSNRCLSTSTNCSRCTRRPMAPLKRPLREGARRAMARRPSNPTRSAGHDPTPMHTKRSRRIPCRHDTGADRSCQFPGRFSIFRSKYLSKRRSAITPHSPTTISP